MSQLVGNTVAGVQVDPVPINKPGSLLVKWLNFQNPVLHPGIN